MATHLVNTVKDLSEREIGLQGGQIDATTASGRMVFRMFATLAELNRDQIRERTMTGLAAATAHGRKGGRRFALTKARRLARAAMAQRDTSVSDFYKELGIKRVILYMSAQRRELRDCGTRVLGLARDAAPVNHPSCVLNTRISPFQDRPNEHLILFSRLSC